MSSLSAAAVPHQEAVKIGEELRKKDKEQQEQADLSLSESEEEELLSNPGESPATPHQSVSGSESSGFRGFNVPDVNPVVPRDVEESETTVFRAKTVVQQAPPASHPTPMEDDDIDMPEPSVPGPSKPGPSRPEPPVEPQPPTGVTSAELAGLMASQEVKFAQMMQTFLESINKKTESLEERVTSAIDKKTESLKYEVTTELKAVREETKAAQAAPVIPTAGLPTPDPTNPWYWGNVIPRTDTAVFFPQPTGERPLSEVECFPNKEAFPNCWIRLTKEAAVREDKIPKETLILPVQ